MLPSSELIFIKVHIDEVDVTLQAAPARTAPMRARISKEQKCDTFLIYDTARTRPHPRTTQNHASREKHGE